MAKLFGTDGIRGIAGTELTPELCTNIGRATAIVLTSELKHRPKILIGMDTRISKDMISASISAGLLSVGADVILCSVVPTPAIAYLVKKYSCDAGVMISASHNPMEFNGIKIFNSNGYKLADDIEMKVEDLIKNSENMKNLTGENLGSIKFIDTAIDDYIEHLKTAANQDLSCMKVLFDCANGAAAMTAKKLFSQLNVKADFIGDEPNGLNINKDCGSTHIDNLAKLVKEGGYDCGIAFDGDADRCLAVDEKGDEIDGDKIIAILATRMKEENKLVNDTAVVTVMSNLGFIKHMQKRGIKTLTTAVGDRYVLEEMLNKDLCLGGEQSGHVILTQHATTGDGQLTAIALLNYFAKEKNEKKVSDFNSCYSKFPQVLINVKTTNEKKELYKTDEYIQGFIEAKQQQLMGNGRVLVRLSGTEPLIRVMVEGEDEATINSCANEIVDKIKERLKI